MCIFQCAERVNVATTGLKQRPPAAIAQLGERQTEDLKVPGSIPGLGTFALFPWNFQAFGGIEVCVFSELRSLHVTL